MMRGVSTAVAGQARPTALQARLAPCVSRVSARRTGTSGLRNLGLVPLLDQPFYRPQPLARHICASVATEAKPETFTYQAEVDRLMDMIVNSLYSNREVFLRELISNASDALDKMRFLSVTNNEAMKGRDNLEILVKADKENNQIIIEDSGIGMTREQLLSNLGTIARSGTRKFMEQMAEAKGDTNLIGQFGVGFYSAFLVADRVTVVTKSWEEEQQWVWESTVGSHQFTVQADESGESLARGTRVILHLKEDAQELADPVRLARLIKMYSQFIQFPIKLYSSKKEPQEVTDEVATQKKQEEEDKRAKEAEEEPKKVEPVTKTDYVDVWDWRVENNDKPLWTRSPKEVAEADYNEFFKMTFGEFLDPLAHVHFNVEGTIEFSSVLFIPGMAPFDQQQYGEKSRNIKLYVRRVFISDEFDDDLMPRYLNFIKGVVDSSDLPLNVSREILQESRIVRVIKKQLTRRSLEMMEDLSKQEGGEDYKTFWESFGRNIKIGIIEDQDNRNRLAKLLRFHSSKSEETMTSLEQYVSRMKEGQKGIFYMAADSMDVARSAPFVEKLVAEGYEVLYLTEPIDEAMVANLAKFDDHDMVDVTKEGLDLGADEGKKLEELQSEFKDVLAFLKDALGERVEKVTVSNRLLDSPCALVTSKFGWSANMERIMKTQSMADPRAMEYMRGRKIMEVNPKHMIVKGIKTLLDEKDKERARDLSELLFETALITSGFSLENPRDYASKVYTLMGIALGVDEEEDEEQQQQAASSSSGGSSSSSSEPKVQAVEAEVLQEGDGGDPWGKRS